MNLEKTISISYAITVCNEKEEVLKLVNFLMDKKRPKDQVVVLFDQKNGDEEIVEILSKKNKLPNFQIWRGFFDNHFADWKNTLTAYCSKDFIFQIDADEMPHENLISNLPQLLELNPDNEVFLVPRVNTVEGLTQEHIQKWGWRVNEKGWVNWPDYQWRIYKNTSSIKWVNKVHERLDGFKAYTALPAEDQWSLIHDKHIEKQQKQNKFYSTL